MIRISYLQTWTPANVADYEQRLTKALETRQHFLSKGNLEAANNWLEYAKWVGDILMQIAQKAEDFGNLVPGGRVQGHAQVVANDIRTFVEESLGGVK